MKKHHFGVMTLMTKLITEEKKQVQIFADLSKFSYPSLDKLGSLVPYVL